MALSVDYLTKVISVPQADLTFVSGTIYKMDTEGYFRAQLMDLWDDEDRIWLDDAFKHNTEVSVAGVTYARVIEMFNGFSVEFIPNSQWTVILEGSNNNIFDVLNGILVQNQVQVIPTNSAGLIVNQGQAISDQDKDDIADKVWDEANADHLTAGSTGKKLADGTTGVIPTPPTVDEIADGVWDEDLTGHTTADTAGKQLSDIDISPIPTPPTVFEISDQVWREILADHSAVVGSVAEKIASLNNDTTPADIASIADAVWNEELSTYLTYGTAGNRLHLTGHISKAIFIDTELSVNGDGTAGSPYNNVNDAKDSAEAHGIKEIITYSELILTSTFKNFIVRGLAAPIVDTNGQDITGSEFYHCTMKGTYIATKQIVAQECALTDGFQLTGYFENCVITGTMNVVGGAVIKNCASGVAGLGTPIFNMNAGVATTLSVRDYSGGILVTNMDHINDICTIEIAQGRGFLDNTNTLGLASFRGVAFFDDTSAGTTVDTSALLDPSKSQLTDEEQIQLFDALTRNQFIGLSD